MKWGSVFLTEDYGDFEWIIQHPETPKDLTYYGDHLVEVNQCRIALRAVLNTPDLQNVVLSKQIEPGVNQVFMIRLSDTNKRDC